MKLKASFNPQTVSVDVKPSSMGITVGNPIARDLAERDPYTGDYSVIPSSEAQTLQTDGLRMTDNITIEPIPSNYGLITWDGVTLTVS